MNIRFLQSQLYPPVDPHRSACRKHLALSFASEAFSVSLRPCNVTFCSFPSSLPNDTKRSQLPSTGSAFAHSYVSQLSLISVLSSVLCVCSQLQLVPGTIPSFRN